MPRFSNQTLGPGRSWRNQSRRLCEAGSCRFDASYPSTDRRLIMTNATITRPEWSTVIDPVLQKELEQHVLVTNWDKLLGIVDTVYNWGRRSALWPLGFGLACCAIEMICTASSRFDIARFGAEVFRGSPRQADLMIVSGTVTKTMMPMIARLYDQMPEPKYVISMGACATGGGPFKEGYNVVSGVDKYIPVDVYIPGCPPTPQALLNGLIMLQKKIDGERLEIPLLGKHGLRALVWQRGRARHSRPGARPRPDRPADRRDRGRADGAGAGRRPRGRAGQAGQDPRAAARAGGRAEPAPAEAAAAPKAPSKIDLIRAKARGEAARRRHAAPAPAAEAKPAPAAKPAKKTKRAEARPSLVWLGDAKLQELADRINAELGAGTVSIIQAALLVPTDKLVDVALFLRDKNPIKYDYLASLQSVHYEDCIEVNYQLDSTDNPGTLIELRVRTAEAEGQGEVPSLYHVYRGADFQEREVYDMMGVRFTRTPRADADPDVGRLCLPPAAQGLPRALLRRAHQGLRQPGRRGARPALPRRGDQPLRHEHEGPQGLQGLGQPLQQRRPQGHGRCCPAASRSPSSTPTSSWSAWARSTRARTASSG